MTLSNCLTPAKVLTKSAPKLKAGLEKPFSQSLGVSNNALPDHSQSNGRNNKKSVWVFGTIAVVLLVTAGVVWYSAKEPEVY